MTASPPLVRTTLSEQVVDRLMAGIVAGQVRDGEVLPAEGDLAARYGVSRAVVREAIGQLRAAGILEVSNGRRARVIRPDHAPLARFFSLSTALTGQSTLRLLEVRRGLETEAAFLAAQRRDDADLVAIAAPLQAMEEVVAATDFDAERYAEADRAFHLAISEASHNELLLQLCRSIREPMKLTITAGLARQVGGRERRAIQSAHRRIALAINAGDAERSMSEMRRHLSGAVARLVRAGTGPAPPGMPPARPP